MKNNQIVDFSIGRSDFGVTVYVPWDCTNNCKFCSSKKSYHKFKSNFEAVKEMLKSIRNSVVPIVTFTGGEPSANIEKLKELISIVDNKIVYINTTLPQNNAEEFIKLVNETSCIESISISRHGLSFQDDSKILFNIAEDNMIAKIEKPVRINVVQQNEKYFNINNINTLIDRWSLIKKKELKSVILNLRCNYELEDKTTLHEMEDNNIINDLARNFYYYNHTFCNVCDTCVFFRLNKNGEKEFAIHYHRGLSKTSLRFGNIVEVNDLIILQNGELCYDWDNKTDNIERLKYLLEIK